MDIIFEELDNRDTHMGRISLRKRTELQLGGVLVYEVKLGDEFLMSSLFHAGEDALAEIGLAGINAPELDVVVGGLGLGYTAATALRQPGVRSLLVVDTLAEVIGWHKAGLVPLGEELTRDPRCRLIHGDFFGLARGTEGFDPEQPGRRFHAILLDIDHSPSHLLASAHGGFYSRQGLEPLLDKLHPGGVFALWSNDPPETGFIQRMQQLFVEVESHIVRFHNPFQHCEAMQTVYVARKRE
jgi:spermidine synthase